MVLCSRCKKRPAVVFITSMHGNEKKNEGLCMLCAKEMNIPQISEYMEQMGITDEDLEQMSDQMMEILDGDGFEMGGADTMPPYIQNLMNNGMNALKAAQEQMQSGDSKSDLPAEKKSSAGNKNEKSSDKRKRKRN